MLLAISGERAKAARVRRISALRSRGTEQPTSPKREATGSHDWFSYITTRAASSCIDQLIDRDIPLNSNEQCLDTLYKRTLFDHRASIYENTKSKLAAVYLKIILHVFARTHSRIVYIPVHAL